MIFGILNKIPPKLHAIHTHFCTVQDIKSGKCENSAQKWPDYVKITHQNSTDYVKTAIFAMNNVRLKTWIICLKER